MLMLLKQPKPTEAHFKLLTWPSARAKPHFVSKTNLPQSCFQHEAGPACNRALDKLGVDFAASLAPRRFGISRPMVNPTGPHVPEGVSQMREHHEHDCQEGADLRADPATLHLRGP